MTKYVQNKCGGLAGAIAILVIGCGGTSAGIVDREYVPSFAVTPNTDYNLFLIASINGTSSVGTAITVGGEAAPVWFDGASFRNFLPAGFVNGACFASVVDNYGGIVQATLGRKRAALWIGADFRFIDLHPSDYVTSQVNAISPTMQGGAGYKLGGDEESRALVWLGSKESVVSLHPPGYTVSTVRAIDGQRIVGNASIRGGTDHAVTWVGGARAFVDLHPPGFSFSLANGVSGDQVVGQGNTGPSSRRALMWPRGTAEVIDVTPPKHSGALLLGTNGEIQVGIGIDEATLAGHAMFWRGTAESAVSLYPGLKKLGDSVGLTLVESAATRVNADGVIAGYAGDSNGKKHIIVWRR